MQTQESIVYGTMRPYDPIEAALDEQDFLVYEQMYAESRTMVRKPRPQATEPGKIIHEGEPLDFSFLKLQDITSLRRERPRGGKRIAIEKEEEEEEKKEAVVAVDTKAGDGLDAGSKVEIVKNQAVPAVMSILANHSISLVQQKAGPGGRSKQDDGKEETKAKKELEFQRTTLLLNNNQLRELTNMWTTLETYVIRQPMHLQWLNLSHNYLVKIDAEILKFPYLKALQLHGNYINNLAEVEKLQDLGCLYSLTLNGNPIEAIKGYRMYVLGLMYAKYETLKKLDSTVITKGEYDAKIVWNDRLNKESVGRGLRRIKPTVPIRGPPALQEDDDVKK